MHCWTCLIVYTSGPVLFYDLAVPYHTPIFCPHYFPIHQGKDGIPQPTTTIYSAYDITVIL